MLEKPSIPDEAIRACVQENYGLAVRTLDFLPLGDAANAGTYRVQDESDNAYFLKLKVAPLYQASCDVPYELMAQGLQDIIAPLPTKQNKLWAELGDLLVILYPFVEGNNGWKVGMAERHWRELGRVFRSIHSAVLPPELLPSIRKETFDCEEWRWVKEFDPQIENFEVKNRNERDLISLWLAHRSGIRTIVTQMEKLAGILRENAGPNVICHADLHPGNILLTPSDRLFVIDWDDVKLAPRERDFLFMQLPRPGENAAVSPFFQGYEACEIDWIALTYYRCERVAQDVAVYTQGIFLRDDLGEETKAHSVQGFGVIFEPGSEFEAVFEAAQHLPDGLRFSQE